MSVPFDPPKVKHMSLREVVKRLPDMKYQLYFNDPVSTKDIESNVRVIFGLILFFLKLQEKPNLPLLDC